MNNTTASEEIPDIELYSDGGADPNPGQGGYGVILSYRGHQKELSQGFALTTNNRMELMGVIAGLEQLKTSARVAVFSDSKYVVNGIEKGWAKRWKANNWYRTKKEKAVNYDLWARLLILLDKHEVTFNWVKGHNGHPENERCDELATMAMNQADLKEDVGFEPTQRSSSKQTESPTFAPKPKITQEGDPCRKCGTPVEKKTPRRKKISPKQSHYYEYYFACPSCKTMYMTEEAKRAVSHPNLFD